MDDSVISPGNKMADSASESDSSSLDGGAMLPPSTVSRDQLQKRIESLQQQNRVLKVELDTYKLRVKALQEENRALRQASVSIQAKAEQEEEYISNTLLKKIQALKKEKETLAHHYEREEECLTNDLSRKLNQLRQEKCRLEQTLEQEQECLVNKLMRKIEKLEAETLAKQTNLERLRREKVELENTLEQEQEALVNRLWKRMDKLEAEKRSLQIRLDQPISDPASPSNGDTASNLSNHIQTLRSEVVKLRNQLAVSQNENKEKIHRFALEEKHIREENLRLQRKLQQEVERREALCRHLSESESSLEMEEERQFNEVLSARSRSVSSPGGSRPLSPYAPPLLPNAAGLALSRPALHLNSQARRASERFVKPAVPGAAGVAAGVARPPEPALLPPASAPPPLLQPASPMDTSSKD
ncbi:coiled-coil domain-containing protein 6 isoform X2 [Pectinophora gossypiella]|uniref:coiled-coil domain-containing protein 6 isoform X2 n=1 Tax=Pectinophora gossypiella TaxID=13191 RepID=UPI00214F4000|nr:coiled-coil domain-containing protein 6 isoform X2 [Pectinophora gossypiella]